MSFCEVIIKNLLEGGFFYYYYYYYYILDIHLLVFEFFLDFFIYDIF